MFDSSPSQRMVPPTPPTYVSLTASFVSPLPARYCGVLVLVSPQRRESRFSNVVSPTVASANIICAFFFLFLAEFIPSATPHKTFLSAWWINSWDPSCKSTLSPSCDAFVSQACHQSSRILVLGPLPSIGDHVRCIFHLFLPDPPRFYLLSRVLFFLFRLLQRFISVVSSCDKLPT